MDLPGTKTVFENKMAPLGLDTGDLPMEGTLCAFINKEKKQAMLGYLTFTKEHLFRLKAYALDQYFPVNTFTHYQYILNPEGGYYFLKDKI